MPALPSYDAAAVVLSVISLAFVSPVLFLFGHYFRGLDFLQMAYFFSLALGGTPFAAKLGTSVVNFGYNIFNFCTQQDFVCSQGFQLSFGAVLAGLIIFLFLVIICQKGCKQNIRFQPVYLSIKGFIKWIYISLVVISTKYLIAAVDNKTGNVVAPAVVFGGLSLLPIFQVIGYECIQEYDYVWRKWIEFSNYLRALSVGVLLGVSLHYQDPDYCHYIAVPLVAYAFIYVWKGEFKYPVKEGIICALGECSFLILFFLYKYAKSYVADYDLDFFLIGFVILIDVILYLVRIIRLVLYGQNEGLQQNPQDPNLQQLGQQSPNVMIVDQTAKKMTRYERQQTEYQQSHEYLSSKAYNKELQGKKK